MNAPFSRLLIGLAAGALCLCLWLAAAGPLSAQEAVAVLSSGLGPYQEAYEGLQEAFGRPVPRINLDSGRLAIPRGARIVIAIGGKAALEEYPEGMAIIYCLAPGTRLEADPRQTVVKVHMLPQLGIVIQRLREIQPAMKRLALFWASEAMQDYVQEATAAASSSGIEVLSGKVGGPGDLPERLRGVLRQGADALWLPPDPLLINPRSFSVLKEFSWANDIPLYVPTAGLVEKGAVASVSCSFREIGRTAGRTARQTLVAKLRESSVYPERIETTVNLTAALEAGLRVRPEDRSRFDRVLP